MTNRTAPVDLPALRTIVIGNKQWRQGWFTEKEVREMLTEQRDRILTSEHHVIEAFLRRSGQWLTNEATHKAFEAETRRKALEEASSAIYDSVFPKNPPSDWTEYACHRSEACSQAQKAIRALIRP